jgi:predicted anti-sigma-YlaC factor YlaD
MRCHDARKQLQFYIDNELTMNQVRELEGHIAQCDACSRELYLLEEVSSSLRHLRPIAEPADLTMLIMQRVAMSPQQYTDRQFSLWRPSIPELVTVVILASITTLGIIWQQPSLRDVLPFAAPLSQTFSYVIHLLYSGNMGAISFALWLGGAILGIFITLALAGNEIRSQWFKAMLERLPVH